MVRGRAHLRTETGSVEPKVGNGDGLREPPSWTTSWPLLEAAVAFLVELGLELDGEALVEGRWADRVVGLDNFRVDVAMERTPDGHGRLELMKFQRPSWYKFAPLPPRSERDASGFSPVVRIAHHGNVRGVR